MPGATALNEQELLKFALSQGMIDLHSISNAYEMDKERKYLKKHKSRIWQGASDAWYTYLVIDGKRKQVRRKTKEELEKVIIEHYKSTDPELEPTFKEEYEAWIESKKKYKEVKEASLMRYADEWKRYFEGTKFAETKVEFIDDIMLDEFIRRTIFKFNLTAKAYAGFRTVLRGVLMYAKRYHHTELSPSTFFKDFQISQTAFQRPSPKRKKVYKKVEREVLYQYLMENPTTENLGLALMCLTGLRVGELAALKKEDNISNCHLYIRRTESKTEAGGKRTVTVQNTPKMDHDEDIVIPKAAQRIVDIVNMRTHEEEYLFTVDGRRITAQTFRRHLAKACKAIGIEYRPPHQMRKTYASILLASGTDEAIVKREMRHTDIATTRAYYQFITDDDDREKAIIDRVMGL